MGCHRKSKAEEHVSDKAAISSSEANTLVNTDRHLLGDFGTMKA